MLVWINGETHPLKDAKTSVADHAHLYGDGLFEGIRIYKRKVFKLDQHLDRLFHGVSYLGIKMKMTQAELRQIILDTCKKADISNGYVRVNVTRGTGLGLDPTHIDLTPNVMVMVSELRIYPPEAYVNGLKVVTSPHRVIPPDCLDPRVKCIGRYAANIMAKEAATRAGAGEGLLLNYQGYVAECTGDNIFLIRDSEIYTPHESCGILRGITRDTVIMLAKEAGYTVHETFITPYEIFTTDEAFLTGTAAEVIPMVSLDGHVIGTGKAGPITTQLIQKFREHTETGVPFDGGTGLGEFKAAS